MNEFVAKPLRLIRTELFWALNPPDYIHRRIQGKRNYPPLWLRSHAGNLYDFEGSGGEYTAYLKLLCNLKEGDDLLDVGCGCGLMALNLTGASTLPNYVRYYIGMDIHKLSIDWCKKHLVHGPFCHFIHMDIYNKDYNPYGKESPDNYKFPFEDEVFDVILLKSVFTHMYQEGVENYLNEVKRLLRPGGRCLATFFLLDGEHPKFKYGDGPVRYVRKSRPLLTVGYDESFMKEFSKRIGLPIECIGYGTWSNRKDGLSFQDMVIFRKEDE